MSKKPISPYDFVRIWGQAVKKGESQAWVSEKTGLTQQAVNQKRNLYRNRGVKLPPLKQSGYRGSISKIAPELNKILDEEING